MDFNLLDTATPASAGKKLQLRNPFTGEELAGVTITLLGIDSSEYQQIERSILNHRLERGNAIVTAEKLSSDLIDTLAAVTVGWEGIELDGKVVDYAPEKARLLYSDKRFPWLMEQVEAFIRDRKNFVKPSP